MCAGSALGLSFSFQCILVGHKLGLWLGGSSGWMGNKSEYSYASFSLKNKQVSFQHVRLGQRRGGEQQAGNILKNAFLSFDLLLGGTCS